jgi:hypothetical protein
MMKKRARHMVSACVAILALVALPAAATAAPAGDRAPGPAWSPAQLVEELVSWLGGWLDGPAAQSLSASSSHTIDSRGRESPALDDGGTVTTQGGASMDPNG